MNKKINCLDYLIIFFQKKNAFYILYKDFNFKSNFIFSILIRY